MVIVIIFGIIYSAVYYPESFTYNSSDFQVQPEYLTGILSASAILFGLWAVIIERKPKGVFQDDTYYNTVSISFWVSFILLIASVLFVSFTAVNVLSSSFALSICVLSFALNAFFLSLTMHFYIFRKVSESDNQEKY
jgi:hypothetical protein